MERTPIQDIRAKIGQEVKLQGFVKGIRDQKRMQFMILRDRSGIVQLTAEKTDANSPLNQLVSRLTMESAVEVVGTINENPAVRLGGIELLLRDLRILSLAEPVLPIDLSAATETDMDRRLDWRFLDLRDPAKVLVFEVQTTIEMAMRQFWVDAGFIEIHSPKIMGSPSESGAELFSIKYFDTVAYLAQSPQFYKQMAMAAGFERVFEIGPVFRANPSFTSRHDTEFTSVDTELSWIQSHYDVMAFEERWLQYVIGVVQEKHGAQIKATLGVDIVVPSIPFPKVTMDQAHQILREIGHVLPADTKEGDLDSQGEKLLCRHLQEQTGHEFVFVIDYPISIRPFYHMRHEDQPGLTKSFDLLWKGLEVTTGAQREHRYEILCRQALEKGLTLEGLQFYLDFFKYGCPPHGGYGFGLTRMLMALLGQSNVREVTFLYRGPTRLFP